MEKEKEIKPIRRTMLAIIDRLKEYVLEDCDDDEIAFALERFNPQRFGYIKEDEYINYDKAMSILGLGNNRVKLNELCKKYKIQNRKFNNVPIGFKRSEIEQLGVILAEESKRDKPTKTRRRGLKYSAMRYDF